jgi:hypothetical protein
MKLCQSCPATEEDHDTKFIELDGKLLCEECVTEMLRHKGEEYKKLSDVFYGREYDRHKGD